LRQAAVAFIGCRWLERRSELAFATRSLAGAASRTGPVAILVPGNAGRLEADGAFDLHGLGSPGALHWPDELPTPTTVIVDELTPEVATMLSSGRPSSLRALSHLGATSTPGWQSVDLVGGDDPIGIHVPVNRLAERHRHHGFGFTDYVLVLSDRTGSSVEEPTPSVARVSAAFNDVDVVLVEDAVASAWKGQTLRGMVAVDTRMDLWRLLAHANVCIDLAPGRHVARECIEALRFGTPIIVPDGTGPAAIHAQESGGSCFGDPDELLAAVGRMQDSARRTLASDSGRRYADGRFGDPAALVARVQALLNID
jgi:hypothetical protein